MCSLFGKRVIVMRRDIVAIYSRLSDEDRNKKNAEDDSESIQNQKNMLVQFAYQKGWDIYNIYSDDDYAGTDRNRPQFNAMLREAEQRKFNIILCKSQARFSRELEIIEKYIHGLFLVWGIRFIGLADNADTLVPGNKKARQINGLVNEWYLEDLSENIKSVFNTKRADGIHIGSFALYGYQKDLNQKGHLIIDEPAAAIVREIFEMFAGGMGKTAIARELNRRGLPNPSEYKRLQGLRFKNLPGKNSTLWSYTTISHMLSEEMYIGNMVQGRYGTVSYKIQKNVPRPKECWYRKENTHAPIIEKELWDKVQKLREERSKPCYNGKISLFAGKVKCMYCGYTMRIAKNRQYRYYKCSSRFKSVDACEGGFIPFRFLEEYVLTEFKKMCCLYLDTNLAEKMIEVSDERETQMQAVSKELTLYQKRVSENEAAFTELYRDKVNHIISAEEFQRLAKGFETETKKYEERIRELEKQLLRMQECHQKLQTRKEILQKYTTIDELNYDIINTFISHIEVGRRLSKRPIKAEEYPIKIHWNF